MKNKFSEHLTKVLQDFGPDQNLLIVSKTRSIDEILAYYDIGHRHFGENRVQELLEKSNSLKDRCPEIQWHMIGHLQSNKVKDLFKVHNLYAIHSVDSLSLLQELIKHQDRLDKKVGLFFQFNTSREEEKSGLESFDDLIHAHKMIMDSKRLFLQGLMTMGSLRVVDQLKAAQQCFSELVDLRDKLSQKTGLSLELSMGMSQDYHVALSLKTNWARLGTMMFELR